MAKKSVSFVFCVGIAMLLGVSAFAQDNRITSAAGDKYVISAKAGGVNYTEGTVSIVRKNGRSGILLKGDELEIGDRVSTGVDGRVEILLNPGSYMRIGANSAFELKTTSLDDLKIRIDGGSAMFEVFADYDFKVSIVAPKARMTLVESGIYRVDVQRDGSAKISVWDGRVELGDVAKTEIKKGRVATIIGSNSSIAKFDRDDKDVFVAWSKARGKQLAKATTSLRNQAMRSSLINSFNSGRWGMYNSFGLWVFDSASGGSCFLPFGSGWYSPYGYGYGNSIWWYNLPPVIYYAPPTPNQSIYGVKTRIRGVGDETVRDSEPPFVKMENGSRDNQPIRSTPDYTTDRRTPSYTPSYSPPPVVVAAPPPYTGARP